MDEHHIDYLRVTTWNFQAYTAMVTLFRGLGKGWRETRWLQYNGFKTDTYFYGQGAQDGRRHFVLQASGPSAMQLLGLVRFNDHFYCTRIDLQTTIKEPDDYDAAKLYDDVRALPDNRRNTSLILSDTGSTVYFGNRSSDTFSRCYQKNLDDIPYLRLELEIKGATARKVYENIRLGHLTFLDAYRYIFRRFTKPQYLDDWFSLSEPVNGEYIDHEVLSAKNSRLEWLLSLEATIIKMGNDHVTGQPTKALLERILEKIDVNTT